MSTVGVVFLFVMMPPTVQQKHQQYDLVIEQLLSQQNNLNPLFKQMPLQNEQQHYRIPTINIKNRRLLQYTAAVLVDRNTICCLFLTGRYDYSAIFNAQGGDAVVV